jgi:hypothetical protein
MLNIIYLGLEFLDGRLVQSPVAGTLLRKIWNSSTDIPSTGPRVHPGRSHGRLIETPQYSYSSNTLRNPYVGDAPARSKVSCCTKNPS